ncbi:TldD/PmbA family protein, partial [candidate division KSB1 bacterium]|nr:TldD/PmbA family protein [candidate division KSB1 bacterium]
MKDKLVLAEWAVEFARKQGADQVAVSLSNQRRIEVEYREKKLDKLQEATENSLSISIYLDQRYSVHSTNDLRRETLEVFIKEAVAGTKYLSQDKYRSLPDPDYYPNDLQRDLQIFDPAFEKVQTEQRVKIAAEIEKTAMATSPDIISVTTSYSDRISDVIRVHSNGFEGHTRGTSFSAGAEATVDDHQGGRPEDWFYVRTRFFDELPPAQVIGPEPVNRALRKVGQKKIDSGEYNMIVENRSVARLLGTLQQAMSGSALQQKSSFLDGKLGEKIASEKLTLIDNPFLAKGLGSRLFDSEGLAAKERPMIEKGVLKNFYIDNYYGKKLGMELTSGSPSNVLFDCGDKSLVQLIKEQKKALLINGFIGGNSNSTTGDFSFGIVGLLINDGEIVQPVNEMNISG